jgi:nuclear pore complex protein Nup98-Nup96
LFYSLVIQWPCAPSIPIPFPARALINWSGNKFADARFSQELRMQDYQQNRKTAGSNTFGQSAFGSTAQPAPTTNLFGHSAQQQQQPQPTNSIFGSFGNASANNANPGGAFGGLGQNPPAATGGFGTFNQPSQQPSQQPATSGFGSFGQPQQQQNTGLFGNSGGAFGPQNKPSGGFGTCHNSCP